MSLQFRAIMKRHTSVSFSVPCLGMPVHYFLSITSLSPQCSIPFPISLLPKHIVLQLPYAWPRQLLENPHLFGLHTFDDVILALCPVNHNSSSVFFLFSIFLMVYNLAVFIVVQPKSRRALLYSRPIETCSATLVILYGRCSAYLTDSISHNHNLAPTQTP